MISENVNGNECENVWMNEEIRREIGVRKRYNRERRNLPQGAERNDAWEKYREAKEESCRYGEREYKRI